MLERSRLSKLQISHDVSRNEEGCADIADLSELNAWLEKFVVNSTKELTGLNTRLTSLVGPEDGTEGDDSGAPRPPIGLPDLVADMHAMVSEQKRKAEAEGMVGQRLDVLLQMMGAEKERHAGQQNSTSSTLLT